MTPLCVKDCVLKALC